MFLTYDRTPLLLANIQRFVSIQHVVDSVIVVWNHPTLDPGSFSWPETPFPIKVNLQVVNYSAKVSFCQCIDDIRGLWATQTVDGATYEHN